MIDFSLDFMNVMIPYAAALMLKLYPMWKTRDVKTRSVVIYVCCFTLYICAGLFIVKQFRGLDFKALQYFKLFASLPNMLAPFWVFRKRFWQNVFLYSMSYMYTTVSSGVSMFAGENWFAVSAYPLLGANLVSLAAIALTLPPLLFFLRRLCENPDMKRTSIWRFIWLFPMLFFGVFMLSGSPFDIENFHGNGFLVIRALIYAAALLTCYLLETSLRQVSENIKLKESARLTEMQLAMQREQYEKVMENAETVKTMRHDIRHHLTVIGQFADRENAAGVKGYVEDLIGKLPAGEGFYCKNNAVNAVAAHYLGLAENEGVIVETRMVIPEGTGSVPAMDLCIIAGNFLENALEACRRMERGDRFIRVRSRIDGDTLSIVVTNSFDGLWREENGAYLSRKETNGSGEAHEGVGLASVKAVCEKHRGLVQFEIGSDVWKSSALVHMQE